MIEFKFKFPELAALLSETVRHAVFTDKVSCPSFSAPMLLTALLCQGRWTCGNSRETSRNSETACDPEHSPGSFLSLHSQSRASRHLTLKLDQGKVLSSKRWDSSGINSV